MDEILLSERLTRVVEAVRTAADALILHSAPRLFNEEQLAQSLEIALSAQVPDASSAEIERAILSVYRDSECETVIIACVQRITGRLRQPLTASESLVSIVRRAARAGDAEALALLGQTDQPVWPSILSARRNHVEHRHA